jgi:hypothetical protein
MDRLEGYEPAVLQEKIAQLSADVSEARAETRGLKRALYSFALSVTLAAFVFGVTMLQVVK